MMYYQKKHSIRSYFVMVLCFLILLSSSYVIPTGFLPIEMACAATEHTDSSYNDFINGTLSNLTIHGIGSKAKLVLDPEALWYSSSSSTKPPMMYGMKIAAINGTDRVVLFGGYYYNGWGYFNYNETWIYELIKDTWTKMTPKNLPPGRSFHGLASVENDDKVVMFGGYSFDGSQATYYNDTWIYDLSDNDWTRSLSANAPSKRSEHTMVTIYTTDKVLLWGGNDNGTETWVFDLSDDKWTKKSPPAPPKNGKRWPAMAPVNGTDKVVLFGGTDDPRNFASFSSATNLYDLSQDTWTYQNVKNVPTRRAQHAMATIYDDDKVVMFGGYYYTSSGRVMLNDTWVFDLSESDWLKKNMILTPSPRIAHDMESVYGRDEVVLYGGFGTNPFGMDTYLDDTWIYIQSLYPDDGRYVSRPFNIDDNATFTNISWNGLTSANTDIQLQLRSASLEPALATKDFVGPDGSTDTYYATSPSVIWSGHEQDRWLQYKVILSSFNKIESPELFNVTIWYNYWPDSIPFSPDNDAIINYNTPTFDWAFLDQDSNSQIAYQIQISGNINFETIDFDSGYQISSETSWQFPTGTTYTKLPDGTWYWRVRSKDNDGLWGEYSEPFILVIDTTLPKSEIIFPINTGYYNKVELITGNVTDPLNGTGINIVEVAIKHFQAPKDKYWDGSKWTTQEIWHLAIGTHLWSYNASSVPWVSGEQYVIQTRATDNATNLESPDNESMFTFDTDEVVFSNPLPGEDEISFSKYVDVGINIIDLTSLVNASTIEYTISTDIGTTWSTWLPLPVLEYSDAALITVELTLEFVDGNANRIKWRAADITGNGLTESEVYTVKVYDIQSEHSIPKVHLLSPENRTIVTSNSVLFNWSSENLIKTNITYDLFLDTVYPPVEKRIENQTGTSIIIDDLVEGETYYWTVVPWRLITGKFERGVCTNGTWSFKVDTSSIPKVSLIYPDDEAVVNKIWLTLGWQVDYAGGGAVLYDVYIDKKPDPELRFSGVPETYQELDYELEDGQTYYWKIVPTVEGIPGSESETWSFTVDLSKAPYIDFSLELDKTSVELKPGENITVTGSIKNIGDIEDSIKLKLINPNETIVIGSISKSNILNITPNEIINFKVEIEIPLGVIKQNVTLIIEATSESAPDYNLKIKRDANLIVNIIEETSVVPTEPEKDGEPSNNLGLIIGIIVIIIVVVIALSLILIQKKKQYQQKEDVLSPPAAMEPAQPLVGPVPYMQPMQPMPPFVPMQPIAAPIPQIGTAMPMNIQQPIQSPPSPTSTAQPQEITQPQEVTAPTQQNLCSTCGQELIFNQQNNNYYCGHRQNAGD